MTDKINVSYAFYDNKANITGVTLVCNTNRTPQTLVEAQNMSDKIHGWVIEELMTNNKDLEFIFGGKGLIRNIEVKAFDMEIGGKMRREHFNLSLNLYHYVGRYSVSKLAKRMKVWLDTHTTVAKAWHVHATLHQDKMQNYSKKETRWENNDLIENTPELRSELIRLSSPRRTVEVDKLGEKFRTLQFT